MTFQRSWMVAAFLALVGFGVCNTARAAAKSSVLDETESLWPKDVAQQAAEHWKELETLKRKHRDAVKELDRAVSDGQTVTGKLNEEISLANRLLEANLALDPGPEEKQVLCRRTIERFDHLREAARSNADELTINAAKLGTEIKQHVEKYPARTPEEIQALVEQAEATLATYREVHAKYGVGARGGEAEKDAYAGCEACGRIAALLEAIGDRNGALTRRKQACEYANGCVMATTAAYEAGTITLDLVLQSQHLRAQAWLALSKLDAAEAATLRRQLREKK